MFLPGYPNIVSGPTFANISVHSKYELVLPLCYSP
jgi:hypothetical protein